MSPKYSGSPSVCWTLPLVNIVFAMGLCVLHFYAEAAAAIGETEFETSAMNAMDAWTRITSGPVNWSTMDKVLFVALVMAALELLNFICNNFGDWVNAKTIPVRGKHLDDLSPRDRLFIGISKAQTGPFLYLFLRYCFHESNVIWTFEDGDFTLQTVLLPLPVLYIVYDFFYTVLHGFLHLQAVYPLIHKHHHHQKAPSRATDDAVNVHPVEFTLGEYNHLWTIFLCCRVMNMRIHNVGALLFLAVGGVLAGLNHSRFDLSVSLLGVTIYDSKAHDVHHRIPQSNYGQYTMFWDYLFGSYRPYNPNDRVNPKAQLDPKTGKSYNYENIQARSSKTD
mmetsp:Transcript_23079/g.63986  ORF Transcript_23079/g.63986 Transcript_23079/m.63986 type:complete len:336 (+) Transcript_23079:242-1249(+)